MRRALTLIAVLALWTTGALAQATEGTALLIADQVDFTTQSETLHATGNVEVFYNGVMLRARAIRYDKAADSFEMTGPITLIEGDGAQVLVADAGALSADLRQGILRGARLVLDRQLQIAASQVTRSDAGRFTEAYQTVASSCTICEAGETPLWQIRAKSVIHDRNTRYLYFQEAQLRVAGVPVAYLPRLRLLDPTVERASGFLVPEFIGQSQLGAGVKAPYFWAISDHSDLLLTPYITAGDSYTLQARYRQMFQRGWVEFEGALSKDQQTRQDLRSYMQAQGAFALTEAYTFRFDVEMASDDDYMLLYDFSEQDRLESTFTVDRIDRGRRDVLELVGFQSLRTADDNSQLPTLMTNLGTTRRFAPAGIGGIGQWNVNLHGHTRTNSDPSLGPSNSARDVMRLDAGLEWGRAWHWTSGLVTRMDAALYGESYKIAQDPLNFSNQRASRVTPYLGLLARLPLIRSDGRNGVTHRLEPMAQLVLAPKARNATPNEDSVHTEFDEGNLFAFSRYSGVDARELGSRLNLGLRYSRQGADGWAYGLTAGRTFRAEDLGQFNPGSGLDGQASDWMLAGYLDWNDAFRLESRSLFDDQFTFAKSETFLRLRHDGHSLDTGYTWLQADPAAGRPIDTSEWSLNARYALARDWIGRVNWNYDFLQNDATDAGFGLTYYSDCIRVDFDVDRRFTSTSTLRPATTYSVTVALLGFGRDKTAAGENRGGGRACYL